DASIRATTSVGRTNWGRLCWGRCARVSLRSWMKSRFLKCEEILKVLTDGHENECSSWPQEAQEIRANEPDRVWDLPWEESCEKRIECSAGTSGRVSAGIALVAGIELGVRNHQLRGPAREKLDHVAVVKSREVRSAQSGRVADEKPSTPTSRSRRHSGRPSRAPRWPSSAASSG